MPTVFAWSGQRGSTETVYQAVASEGGGLTLTQTGQPPQLVNITDGTSNTGFLVEAKPMVPWTKPVDVTDSAKQCELTMHTGGFNCAFGDGSVRFISISIDKAVWKAITTRAGGEVMSLR